MKIEFVQTNTIEEGRKLSSQADLIISDLYFQKGGALQALMQLSVTRPVLVFTHSPENSDAVALLRSGVKGYLLKTSTGEEVVQAVRNVMSGGRYTSASLVDLILSAKPFSKHALSARELQVVDGYGKGKTPGEISQELRISKKTVSTHRSRAMRKLAIKSTAELIRWACLHRA